jgi:hypothetical protein
MSSYLSLAGPLQVLTSCAVVFVPIFFAGVVFAVTLRDSPQPSTALGSNIGGVILGGLAENFSAMIGFDHLLLVALGFYALSTLFSRRRARAAATTM